MKAKCKREDLLTAFMMVSGVVPTRSPKPILMNVKFEATKSEAYLMATDLEVGIRFKLDGITIDEPGQVILPTTRMNAILRETPDEVLILETDETRTRVTGARSRFELPSEAAEEFPEVPDFTESSYHQVAATLLRTMIKRTVFATDPESMRYALNGLHVDLEGEHITVVGTDGRRLAVMRGTAKVVGSHSTEGLSPVVPTKAMHLIDRNLQGNDGDVDLAIGPNKMLLRSANALISSRLVEGRFPRYQEVFPSHCKSRVTLNVRDFLQAVRQSAIVTSEESRGITATFSEGKLALVARSSEFGESQVELPIAYDSEELKVTFDPRYLVDMLRVLNEESTVTLDLIDAESAAVFKTDDGYSYVVMPLTRER